MSRLFGDVGVEPTVQTQLTKETMALFPVHFLTNDDRNMLSELYARTRQQGVDLRYVDDLARDLGMYRMFGGVNANLNNGKMFDEAGHTQTFLFTETDTVTADRILSDGGIARTALDQGFLNYELDPGFSFNHGASFDFLEEVVSKFTIGATDASQTFDPKFSAYQPPGRGDFIIKTSSDVVLPPSDPDTTNINGVFHITETGYKNGYRMVNGEPVKTSPGESHSFLALLEAVEAERMRAIRLFLGLQ